MQICNSEYEYELIKYCRYMAHTSGKPGYKRDTHYCHCVKNCATCSVGGTKYDKKEDRTSPKVMIWMHPDLHEAWEKKQSIKENR